MLEELCSHPVNRALAATFAAAGVPLFLVGGSVRDALCGTPDFSDLDYTTPARPERITELVSALGPVWAIGEEFGTIGVKVHDVKVEVTTFRTETYDASSRKPAVGFGETIREDLVRRDLTINSMAVCLVGDGEFVPGELVDLYGGAEDLASGILRTPDVPERAMSEDPLRQLRVVRFAATRGMAISDELASAIRRESSRLSIVAVERCTEELRKVLSKGPLALASALQKAKILGISSSLVGGLSVSTDALHALVHLEDTSPEAALGLLALLSLEEGKDVEVLLRERKLSSEELGSALRTARLARTLLEGGGRLHARSLVRRHDDVLLSRSVAVIGALARPFPFRGVLEEALGISGSLRRPLPVDGHDLVAAGLTGPAVGRALEKVTETFLENPSLTRTEALALV